jgi:hypothetical protein
MAEESRNLQRFAEMSMYSKYPKYAASMTGQVIDSIELLEATTFSEMTDLDGNDLIDLMGISGVEIPIHLPIVWNQPIASYTASVIVRANRQINK